MIVQVVFVALLLCSAVESDTTFPECEEWVCFTSKICKKKSTLALDTFDHEDGLIPTCDRILMIKPESNMRWRVAIIPSSTDEVKVLQDATDLFSCKNSEPASTLPGFEKMESLPTRPLSCQFLVGDRTSQVLAVNIQNIKIIPSVASTESSMDRTNFVAYVNMKLRCDQSHVQFENSLLPEELTKPTKIELLTVSCVDSQFKLQFSSGNGYQDVTSISCAQDDQSLWKYQIDTGSGKSFQDGPFKARCFAKACSFCTAPSVGAGKTAPELKEEGGCKTLTCPKFFKIGDEPVTEKFVGACTNVENEGPKWTIGGKKMEKVECVDEMPCQKITNGCSGDCKLDSKGMPSCQKKGQTLSATINGNKVQSVNITCDSSRGQLTYKGDAVLPPDTVFSCTEVTAQAIVATGGIPTPLMACLMVGLVLTLALIGCSFALWIWKRNKDKKKAAEDGEKKEKTGEEN